jgi:hypothetical protein
MEYSFLGQKSNYQFLPENVIYISYISGIPMVSIPEIEAEITYSIIDNLLFAKELKP